MPQPEAIETHVIRRASPRQIPEPNVLLHPPPAEPTPRAPPDVPPPLEHVSRDPGKKPRDGSPSPPREEIKPHVPRRPPPPKIPNPRAPPHPPLDLAHRVQSHAARIQQY